MERETKSFTTPKGKTVVMYTYLTGRERRELQNIFLKDVEVSIGDAPQFNNFKATAVTEAQNFMLSTLIRSLDSNAEDCLNRVLDLPSSEYEFILAEVNKISEAWDEKKKQ